MIFVQGVIKVASESLDDIISPVIEIAKASDKEVGCLHYSFAQDISDPSIFHICERWRSEDDLNAHFQEPHVATFNAAIAGLKIESMDVRMYSGDEVRIMMQS
ncbi:putative quinol monooxygenase [Parasphingorhabdus halotolerans]|uniref:Antibiotic biosynthesis monooxygenase n=1 Tax=Parasphingorhabdus halotolerans TaxID=2725558 RepID=A0A6H2DIJ8_9SPHN|nr:putative quinol monooxygenase [Parasphingorhabdus halotolerans]QJB68499.1 antibiotic biosynthesis monooxygenase [Parasphingorhabdus halotolerans]